MQINMQIVGHATHGYATQLRLEPRLNTRDYCKNDKYAIKHNHKANIYSHINARDEFLFGLFCDFASMLGAVACGIALSCGCI